MRALITGGCGFIGSNLTRRLVKEGWTVDVVDNLSSGHIESISGLNARHLPNASFIRHFDESMRENITTREPSEILVIPDDFSHPCVLENIHAKKYDIVFHQAAVPRVAYSVENPGSTTEENISKTVKLFEACIGNVKRVVWASSSSVYGGADILPTSESCPKNPRSPYAWHKSAVEDVAKLFNDLYDLDIVCLRYFNVFGPGQTGESPYSTAVSAWCHATKVGAALRSDGDGEQTRDMCYISNIVDANILAATSLRKFSGRSYNIACGDKVSNNQILDFFIKNFEVNIAHAPERKGDVKHTLANIERAKAELGYNPSVRFWEGLELTLKWWDLK